MKNDENFVWKDEKRWKKMKILYGKMKRWKKDENFVWKDEKDEKRWKFCMERWKNDEKFRWKDIKGKSWEKLIVFKKIGKKLWKMKKIWWIWKNLRKICELKNSREN